MAINILYFAWVREQIGLDSEQVEADTPLSIQHLSSILAERSQAHAGVFSQQKRLRVAVNQVFADWSAEAKDGDEVAFFPPVTGG